MPVLLNSFYGGNSGWFYKKDFMDGMWKHVRGGNGDWTVLKPGGDYLDKDVKKGFAKWRLLPAAERQPGAFPVKELDSPPKNAPPLGPPPGTLVLRVYQRNLRQNPKGELSWLSTNLTRTWKDWLPVYNDSFLDAMWLNAAEWKSLVPAQPKKGDRFPLPDAVKKRLLLWHLTNRTFCVGHPWEERDIRSENLMLQVEETAPVLRMRLEGSVLLKMDGTPEDLKLDWHRTQHGYDARLLGFLDYDPAKEAFTRFDLSAVGDYWGGDCEGGRLSWVGRLPLAISFEIASGDTLQDRILPCGGVYFDSYLKLKWK